jgi:hypothetical protein
LVKKKNGRGVTLARGVTLLQPKMPAARDA